LRRLGGHHDLHLRQHLLQIEAAPLVVVLVHRQLLEAADQIHRARQVAGQYGA
jgi:hypothetical protein